MAFKRSGVRLPLAPPFNSQSSSSQGRPPCRRAGSCPRTHGPDRIPFFTVSNSPKKRIASSDREWQSHRSLAILVLTFRFSLFACHHPLLLSLFLLASVSLSHSPTPDEGRAERRWRSDACEAPVSACLTRSRKTRVNALVTDM